MLEDLGAMIIPAYCGGRLLYGFSNEFVNNDPYTVEQALIRFIKRDLSKGGIGTYHAILNNHQIANGWGGVFNNIGFKAVHEARNPNSGNICTTYVLDIKNNPELVSTLVKQGYDGIKSV